MRVVKDLHWLHVASTPEFTAYHIDAQRGKPAMEAMGILPDFTGTAVHDSWTSYYAYECEHALCNTHHLRELIFAYEEHGQQWAARLKACLLEANEEVTAAKTRGATELPARRLQYFSGRYSRILREGREELPLLPARHAGQRGRAKQHKVKNLHDRLRDHKTEVLAFLYDFSIPFTNNQGEQDVRMMKVKQKISGCFRSIDGARIFARIRGCLSTIKKQGHNALQAMTMLFEDHVDFTRKMTELAEPT
jgi:transposase